MNKFYYTYKITCLCGDFKYFYYLGRHTTKNLDDGYCGSGVLLRKYFKKYGKIEGTTYIKNIISFYDNQNDVNIAEAELIGDKWKNDQMCLNYAPGGTGGAIPGHKLSEYTKRKIGEKNKISLLGKHLSDSTRNKISESNKGKNVGRVHTEESRKHMSEGKKGKPSNRLGKKHTEEAKQKMSEARIGKPSPRLGKKLNNEKAKQKMSEAKKGKHWRINPNTKKREWY